MIEYYSPGEIRFTREQVYWCLEHLPTIIDGQWPKDPKETGYTDAPVRGLGGRKRAPFETPAMIAAEITWRLGQCGKDGKLVLRCYADGWEWQALADILDWNQHYMERRMRRAIAYASGFHRRRYSYKDFINHRRGSNNGRNQQKE